jgi:hypothetical protein
MTPQSDFTLGRDVGLFGRLIRLLAGLLSILFIVRSLGQASVQSGQQLAFLANIVLYFLAIGVVYFLVFYLYNIREVDSLNPWIPTLIFYGPVFVVAAFGLGPAPFQIALSLYVALSLLVPVVKGYGGCEVVALPSLTPARWHTVYCPWNAVDVVEEAMVSGRGYRAFKAISAAILILIGGYFLLAFLGLYELLGLDVPVDDRLALFLLIPVAFFAWNAWIAYQDNEGRSTTEVWRQAIAALLMLALTAAFFT